MLPMSKILALQRKYPLAIFFALSFFIWIFAFRQFIFNYHWIAEDAAAYYQDISYYWRNLAMGHFALWNPFFAEGAPNEFFLRRIGSFNPFLLLIMLLYKLGVAQYVSHTLFLSIYYFIGCVGFYFLAKCLFGDRRMAFMAFALLYFSALGTRVFDSYFLFSVVPMIWFSYFLTTFAAHPQRHQCLGMLFCLMIIFTTYIPFYFVTFFLAFVFCYVLLYADKIKGILVRTGRFLAANKLFAGLCLAVFMVSLLPGIFLYRDADAGHFVMPMRHSTLTTPNALEVAKHWVEWWAILEDLFFSSHFLKELTQYEFAVFYIPVFGCLVFLLSLLASVSRRLVLLFGWGLLIFLIGTPHTPVYAVLSEKVFFFKYFRNLHFFLWMALLPIMILIVTEQFRCFLLWAGRFSRKKIFFALIALFHLVFLFYFIGQEHEVVSTYAVIGLSLLFFYLFTFHPPIFDRTFGGLVLMLIALQPIEVYYYLGKNAVPQADYQYEQARFYEFEYHEKFDAEEMIRKYDELGLEHGRSSGLKTIYYGLPWYSFLYANMDSNIYEDYINYSIHFYDSVQWVADRDVDIREIERAFQRRVNAAFVSDAYEGPESYGDPQTFSSRSEPLPAASEEFKVVRFNPNEVVFKTNLKQPKFVVYNDNFDKRWQGFIDKKPLPIYRANVSFKGFWVPAGSHTVHLRYGSHGKYIFNYGMLILFNVVLISLIVTSLKARHDRTS